MIRFISMTSEFCMDNVILINTQLVHPLTILVLYLSEEIMCTLQCITASSQISTC